MGVKDLWNVLSPLCEKKPVYELQGKTIAIDLSGWIVDSQTIVDNVVQPRMYLRNLYFRTAFLLMHGISPVFVLEGKPPTLKHKTIARRNDIRNGFQERKTVNRGGRTQFNRVLNQCKELLSCIGVACIQSSGEAEAMCAYLNEDGFVDGCISQDSDCFLYGAKIVYRNFCTSTQGNSGVTGGSVDVYSMEKIEKTLNIGRNKMIALALLCGCDYSDGVSGVGKEAALKFFKTVKEEDVLQRIQDWRTDTNLNKAEFDLLNTGLCTSCGHPGKLQKHTKSGCTDCGTIRKCNDDFRETRALILNEISLRKKALHDENFPNQELIDEFLIRKDSVSIIDIKWKQPQINQFIDFMNKHVCWEPQYAFEKIFTLITRWQLLHLPNFTLDERLSMTDLFIPDNIKKIRNIRSIASYEIIWKKEHAVIRKLKEYKEQTNENENYDNDMDDNLLISIEPQDLVLKCYPKLVEVYENTRNVKTKKRTVNSRRKKAMTNVEGNNTEIKDIMKSKRKKVKKKIEKDNRNIDEFITRDHVISLDDSFEKMTITPKRSKQENISRMHALQIKDVPEDIAIMNVKQIKRGPQFQRVLDIEKKNLNLNNTFDRIFSELSPDDFTSENEDDLDVTNVIENICSKQIFQFSKTNCQPVEPTIAENIEQCITINKFEPIQTNTRKNYVQAKDENHKLDFNDEFDNINESYIPISQRIQIEENRKVLSTCNHVIKKYNFDFENIMDQTDNDVHLDI